MLSRILILIIASLILIPPAEAITPSVKKALLCIHRHEAAWTNPGITWDGRRSRYYGGLQMDRTFMRTYAPRLYRIKGTANHWTPAEQLEAGARAVRVRGYSPWPTTRIPCGV